uniref:W2 domain-containing protein n=1 Tax=Mantoniella antarctica TaxID=81844 RepID=A0A7S0SV28_9CHLO|mmetsp:Transcript_35746/g.89278  ORF Transcript_35746/g.89278 Transcript_35746/m.89278 type:complete len:468 (+) Transcript_35746:310-1713(+)
MAVNIGASNAGDQFYRYKMPPIVSKIEGRGNGIKTNVVNMVDVAKALARPASYTTKYFGCELGAQTKFEEKSGLAIVNGAHDAPKLAQMLEGFIKRFVQCFSCGNPETVVNISKKETIHLKCKACGAVSDVDMRHKLCTFMVKNPPENKKSDKKDKNLRRAEKEREEEGDALDKAADEEKKRRKEEKKKAKEEGVAGGGKKSKKEKKEKKDKKGKKDDDDDAGSKGGSAGGRDSGSDPEPDSDDDAADGTVWATDTSATAQAARAAEQLTDASASMVDVADELEKKATLNADTAGSEPGSGSGSGSESEEEEDERIAKLRAYVAKHDAAETAVYLVGPKLGVDKPELGIHFLVEALFDEEQPMAPQIKAKLAFLAAACGADPSLQMALLCAVELYVTETATAEFKKLPEVLKELYDGDVAEEEVMLKWAADLRAAKKFGVDAKTGEAVRKQADPFIQWLQESEEESD